MFQGFEWYCPADHQHWRRLTKALPDLARLGITSIWIPPAARAASTHTNGYDIYDLYDLGEFRQKGAATVHTKWGSKDELVILAQEAAHHGIRILFDAVLNHKAAADYPEWIEAMRVNPEDRTETLGEPEVIEAWTGYDFGGRGERHSAMKWNKDHFVGIDYCHRRKMNGIWKFKGKEWAEDVDEELGNYDYLMFADLDHSHPGVRRDLFHWVEWLSSQLPLGGLRLDAIKHYSARFLRDFIAHLDRTVGRHWFLVGEYWREDSRVLARYIEFMEHRLSLFDVRLVSNFSRVSLDEEADLRRVLDGALVECKPDNAVTFVANHDTQEGQSLETPIAPYFIPLAYALILLRARTGLPCVFWGDLYGSFRTGSNIADRPILSSSGGLTLPRLLLARRFFAYGSQRDYLDDRQCIGFTRLGHSDHSSGAGLAVVMTKGWEHATKTMYVGPGHSDERWVDLLRASWGEVTIDETGHGQFRVAPRNVSVWVNRAAIGPDWMDRMAQINLDIYALGKREPGLQAKPRILPSSPAWLGLEQRSSSKGRPVEIRRRV